MGLLMKMWCGILLLRFKLKAKNGMNSMLASMYLKSKPAFSFNDLIATLNLEKDVSKNDEHPDSSACLPLDNLNREVEEGKIFEIIDVDEADSPKIDTPKPQKEKRIGALKKKSKTTKVVLQERLLVNYADVGGVDAILQDIRELIEWPLTHPEIYSHLGIEPARGILLHGPPGCGKTLLAHAVAGELGVNFVKISAPEVVSGMSGESEAKIRQIFADAVAQAPCLIFIDEIDAITPKRENAQREMERRIVAQLLTCMDSLNNEYSLKNGCAPVIVIGATNRPESLDSALRRAGRFDREIAMTMPDELARTQILKTMSRNMRLDGHFNFPIIGKKTAGFVGADLGALIKEAAVIAVNRIFHEMIGPETVNSMEMCEEKTQKQQDVDALNNRQNISRMLRDRKEPLTEKELEPLCVTMPDFEVAISKVQPSSKREGFATIPDVTWNDIGGLESLREELDLVIAQPIANPEAFESIGIFQAAGILLFGPPGCGKTIIAKAVANQCGASFISVKGPELLNKYVGESERGVRQVFQRARASKPCIIFFDELDSLCPKRGSGHGEADSVSERVVNQLLTEMDGLEDRKQVFVIAATNRPDIIDPAMLRPGRLDKLLYVPLPDSLGRLSILRTHCRRAPVDAETDLEKIASDIRAENFSGADISALVREASLEALKEAQNAHRAKAIESGGMQKDLIMSKIIVKHDHFNAAFSKVLPSVSALARKRYDQMHAALKRYVFPFPFLSPSARSSFPSPPTLLPSVPE